MALRMNRREAITLGVTSLATLSLSGKAGAESASGARVAPTVLEAHDANLKAALVSQITEKASRWCGGIPDRYGLHHCRTAATLLRDGAAAYFHEKSGYCGSKELFERMKLAAGFLLRAQNESGNIDLLVTNFNSPPDTGFVVHDVATAAKLAQVNGNQPFLSLLKEFLQRAGAGMATGGIHTPNHRWVVCAALAQIHDLFPEKRYLDRIEQWLAEGIDIDEEGQYTERSTAGYNAVVDNALVVMAHKLNRPELLEPVRKNLDAMAYLLHPGGEVVTEISHRQDQNTRGTMRGYWFALRYMAIRDGNGMYVSMLKPLEPEHIRLAALMEYPKLQEDLPAAKPVPENYEKSYALSGITRIRRGKTSATIVHKRSSRFFALRRGSAVVNAVRFASAFFGKGQFVPVSFEKRGRDFCFEQHLTAQYYQPIDDPDLLPVGNNEWSRYKVRRDTSEICRMAYETRIRETEQGFEVFIKAHGTDNVPLSVEINFREGAKLSGVAEVPGTRGAFLLEAGFAECRVGNDGIRFGPGHCDHAYVQVRGAEPKLSGPSVYLTAYTPFEHTLKFQLL